MLFRGASLEVAMRRRASLSAVSSLLVFLAGVISAATAQDIFVTPVPNAPFSAVVTIERTFIQRNGATATFRSMSEIGRDSSGRIPNERRRSVPNNSTPELEHVHLYDPQSRVSTEINIPKRTYWTRTMNHPPSTEPPAIRFAAPDGNAPPSEFTKQEDLGIREIAGVPAHGMRQTQTLPGENGGKEGVVTDEHWYSQDLRIYVMIKHSDPRKESSVLTIDQVIRAEPDEAIFKVPEGSAQLFRGEGREGGRWGQAAA